MAELSAVLGGALSSSSCCVRKNMLSAEAVNSVLSFGIASLVKEFSLLKLLVELGSAWFWRWEASLLLN